MDITKRLAKVLLYIVHRDAQVVECDSHSTAQHSCPAMLRVSKAGILVMETSKVAVATSMIALPVPLTRLGDVVSSRRDPCKMT